MKIISNLDEIFTLTVDQLLASEHQCQDKSDLGAL